MFDLLNYNALCFRTAHCSPFRQNIVVMSLFDMFPGFISLNTSCLAHVSYVGFFLREF
jgi:hypothetical protein